MTDIGDMKKRPVLTDAEIAETRRKWFKELETNRHGTRQITSMERVIYLLEENASDINDVMQDKDVNGHYSSHLQAAFDDTLDILDYLRKLR